MQQLHKEKIVARERKKETENNSYSVRIRSY